MKPSANSAGNPLTAICDVFPAAARASLVDSSAARETLQGQIMPPSDPNAVIGGLAIFGLVIVLCWRLIVWVRESPVRPDPWDKEIAQKIAEPEAVQTCAHCSTEQPPDGWFCPHCGAAVGPYNNMMPYVCIFSIGEVLRTGSSGRFRASPWIVIGYVLYALSQYVIAVPLYLFFFFRNLKQKKAAAIEAAQSSQRAAK